MSIYGQTYSSSAGGKEEANALPEEFLSKFPILSEALAGVYDSSGKCKMSKATLMIFLDGGRLKFCISPQGSPRVAFGMLPGVFPSFQTVEDELKAGKFEWKSKRGGKSA